MNRTIPREDARLNRERLIDGARSVFRDRGVAAEMREIAERAGIAIGTIYRNYPSKDDLILALLDSAMAGLDGEADAGAGPTSALDELERLLTRAVETVDRYGWLIEAYVGRQLSERCREEIELRSHQFDPRGRYRALLSRAMEEGEVRADVNPDHVLALLLGVTSPWVCQPLLETQTPDQVARGVVDTLRRGIST